MVRSLNWCAVLGLTVKAAMLGPDSPSLTGGLLGTPHPTPKIDKGTAVNLYLQVGTKDS
jgi:hypothetical protein